jgi:hypothetical protein
MRHFLRLVFMAEQGSRKQSMRMTITVVLLVLLAASFFAASFFVLT